VLSHWNANDPDLSYMFITIVFMFIFYNYRDYINDQALGHMPEDILYEVEQMKLYFDTFIPKPVNT